MLDRLIRMFAGAPASSRDELQLAAAALLVEAAREDGRVTPDERATITRLLQGRFGLSAEDAGELLAAAVEETEHSVQLHGFVRVVNERFSAEQRVELVEMLWDVVYADGHLDDFEAGLLRRVGGLLHVPDQARGAARQRVLARRDSGGR